MKQYFETYLKDLARPWKLQGYTLHPVDKHYSIPLKTALKFHVPRRATNKDSKERLSPVIPGGFFYNINHKLILIVAAAAYKTNK